jgi:hypothetical protein
MADAAKLMMRVMANRVTPAAIRADVPNFDESP